MTNIENMKAVLLSGKPPVRADITKYLTISDSVTKPAIEQNEVLVRVKASAVNIEDIMNGVGRRMLVSIAATKEAPVVLGQEFSGVVEEIGSKVKDFKQGDEVLGHKIPLRVRWGTWAEFVSVNEKVLVKKAACYSFSEAAALPMSALVAYGAVKAAGLVDKPLLENAPHKNRKLGDVTVVQDEENKALFMDGVIDQSILKDTKIAIVGASSTTGLMMVDILASRGLKVVGVSSASSAAAVLANGAVAVLDRHVSGGLGSKGDMELDIVIDCVGGQDIEDAGRKALGSKGHFISMVGPCGNFGDGGDGAKAQIGHGAGIASRSFKSMFSSVKYTQASMPWVGGGKILEQLMKENLKSVIDSEVDVFNEAEMHKAVDKVNQHKNKGRLVFVM